MELKGTIYLTGENTYDSKKNICKLWDCWLEMLETYLRWYYTAFFYAVVFGVHTHNTQRWTWTLLWPWLGRATQKARMLQLLGLQWYVIQCMYTNHTWFDVLPIIQLHVFFSYCPEYLNKYCMHVYCILQCSAGVSWNNYLKTRYHVTIVLGMIWNDELFGVVFSTSIAIWGPARTPC